jgi:chaperonin GroEL
MGAKKLAFDADARKAIIKGVEILTRAVKATYGPRGMRVILEKSWGSPTFTRDGNTVAGEIELPDEFENMGAKMVAEVAKKTSKDAGDGTTAATILAEAIFTEGVRNVCAGADSMAIARGVRLAVDAVIKELKSKSTPVKGTGDIQKVATIAAGNDAEIGKVIAEAMKRAGAEGVVTVEEGKTSDIIVDWVEGMQFDRGYQSPYFITDTENITCAFDDPLILIHEQKLSSLTPLLPILEQAAKTGKALLIISEETEGEALSALVVNKLKGVLNCCAVKAPGFGDRRKAQMQDIAILTGGTAIFEDLGMDLEKLALSDLGRAKRIVVTKDDTTIVKGAGKKTEIDARIEELKRQIDDSDGDYDREKLEERLAKLASGIAQINVGAQTESEMKETKKRVEGALAATRAAVEEGILPGGGVTLLRAADALGRLKADGDEALGVEIVRSALKVPLGRLASNAGFNAEVAVEKVRTLPYGSGLDVITGKYTDMAKAGIIDPTKVVRTSLTNGASVAELLITTEALIASMPEKKKKAGMAEEEMY